MQNDLHLPLANSRLLALLLLAAHALALGVVWHAGWPLHWHIAGKLALLASLLHALDRAGWLRPGRRRISLTVREARRPGEPDSLVLVHADGQRLSGTLLAGSLALPGCIVVHFQQDGVGGWRGRHHCLIPPDAAPEDLLRALRVRLRWGRFAPV